MGWIFVVTISNNQTMNFQVNPSSPQEDGLRTYYLLNFDFILITVIFNVQTISFCRCRLTTRVFIIFTEDFQNNNHTSSRPKDMQMILSHQGNLYQKFTNRWIWGKMYSLLFKYPLSLLSMNINWPEKLQHIRIRHYLIYGKLLLDLKQVNLLLKSHPKNQRM